jgi:hypothetical protein
MTTHRPGKTNTRDPRGWGFTGKFAKRDTARLLRRLARRDIRREVAAGR